MILIQKRFLLLCGGICCFLICFGMLLWQGGTAYQTVMAENPLAGQSSVIVVLDPGHGGPDGGASSPDGVQESHINLDISFRIRDLLAFCGQESLMTRTEDISIHTPGADRWKASDLQNRVLLVNETENAVLLSIHQNSLPSSPVTHGAQVFHNQAGAPLAAAVQAALNEYINPGNEKQMKSAPTGVYLMKHIKAPGILIECGFLSNAEETLRLQESSYQIKLAAAVTAGVLQGIGENPT